MKVYDRIHLSLRGDTFPEFLNLLQDVQETVHVQTGEIFYKGKHKNLSVIAFPNRCYIAGSLCTYFLGSSLKTLTMGETKSAIQLLSDELLVNISNARISRFEFGATLITEYSFSQYSKFFGEMPRHTQYLFGNRQKRTLVYSNKQRQLRIYDKALEMYSKGKGLLIPSELKASNTLRYEVEFRRPSKEFRLPEVRAYMLYEKDFFNKAIERWINLYSMIRKVQRMKLVSQLPLKSATHLSQIGLAFIASQQGFYEMLMAEIEARDLTRSQRSRMKAKLGDARTGFTLTEPDKRIVELDQNIIEAANKYKQQ